MADWFTIAEARAVKPLEKVIYTDALIVAARALAQSAIEDACGVAFTPTAFTGQVVYANGGADIFLRPRLLTVTTVTQAGTAVTLTDVEVGPDGVAYRPNGWPAGRLVVAGTYGYAAPPERVKRAAIQLAKRYLVDTPINDRTTSLTTVDGNTERFVTAGLGTTLFDVPEVNAVVQLYGVRPGLAVA